MSSAVRDLQLSLDQFAAKCEALRVRISTSKVEAMVLSHGEEILLQVEDYLGILFTREGKLEWEIDRWIDVA